MFKEDTKSHLLKCLNEDIGHGKLQKAFRKDFAALKEVLQKNYHIINATFLFYAGQSYAYPALAIEDFSSFAEECGLLDEGMLSEVSLMKCFTETYASTNGPKRNNEKSLYRFEFLEILVRIAAALMKDSQAAKDGKLTSLASTLTSLLNEVIFKHAQRVNRYKFRKMLINDIHVTEILNKNAEVL